MKWKALLLSALLLTVAACAVLFTNPKWGPTPQERPRPKTQSHDSITKQALSMDDICVTVKTTKKNYASRVELILNTWFKTAKGQVYLVTDLNDEVYQNKSDNMLVTSKCGGSHSVQDLCCKVGRGYDTCMAEKNMKWWCNFDDDNYVHVDRLVEYLGKFDYNDKVYIGRRSIPFHKSNYKSRTYKYQFGTGGAGFCISKFLAEQMRPWIGVEAFPMTCMELRQADDCVIGFVTTQFLGANLTECKLFHSHYEDFRKLPTNALHEQVVFSYKGKNVVNLAGINAAFTVEEDPTRIKSLHCHLYPHDPLCQNK